MVLSLNSIASLLVLRDPSCPLWFKTLTTKDTKVHEEELSTSNLFYQLQQRIIEFIDHTFFQRNDGVVSDVNFFRADFGAALGDVAVAEAQLILEQSYAGGAVKRMHF